MAELVVEVPELVVRLSPLEKLGGLLGDARFPLSAVNGVREVSSPYAELRGIRVGTGIPWVIVLGRMWFSGGADLVALYGTGPGVIVELEGQRFQRLLLTGVPAEAVGRLREAVASFKP